MLLDLFLFFLAWAYLHASESEVLIELGLFTLVPSDFSVHGQVILFLSLVTTLLKSRILFHFLCYFSLAIMNIRCFFIRSNQEVKRGRLQNLTLVANTGWELTRDYLNRRGMSANVIRNGYDCIPAIHY